MGNDSGRRRPRTIIIRPGALGDVLVVRGVIRFLRETLPGAEIFLIAPGGRGDLFVRKDWIDASYDWDGSAFSWLFSEEESTPPPVLAEIFDAADMIFSYALSGQSDAESRMRRRLSILAPNALVMQSLPRPPDAVRAAIGEWLVRGVAAFCAAVGYGADSLPPDPMRRYAARMTVPARPPAAVASAPYSVIHPGSGSAGKNWPLESFCELGRLMLDAAGSGFGRLVVTAGDADGDAGERLAAAVPGAVLVQSPTLAELAGILSSARCFIGNDTGVSHLASLVQNPAGESPCATVLFGPTDPVIWGPPGSLILDAGRDMRSLAAATVFQAVRERYCRRLP